MGVSVTGPSHLDDLGEGASVRFAGRLGPGLALRNEDGSWSVTGMSTPLCSEELWGLGEDMRILSAGRALAEPATTCKA